MLAILNTTSILFITIGLGLISGICGLFKKGDDHVLINYVFYLALPLNLFLSCYNAHWQIFNAKYLASYILAITATICLSYLISRHLLKVTPSDSHINALAATQVDGAYFTMPLFNLIFKSTALAVPLMLIQNVVFFSIGVLLLQLRQTKDPIRNNWLVFIVKRIGQVLLYNPLISLSLLGLLLHSWQIRLPQIVLSTAKFVGNSASAVALFSLGITCALFIRKIGQLRYLLPLAWLTTLKLIALPLIALIFGKLFDLNQQLTLALVLLTGSPAATHTYIIANKYETDSEVATFNVVVTTILSFITINLWLYCFTSHA